ncbi:hypothetical protein L3Q82_000096 [Scortum barcoo]|uniref:Uncharacterized protein n=1 Tax=Scortum barcoo TaxID=214431 RepID=A0ACB8X9K3_9TELE|nr:hypothetical protein L3Q82_000096 [Scortum barcoo]
MKEMRLTSDQKMSVCVEEEEDRSESAGSSCLSMKSDRSKDLNPAEFSNEPGPSDTNFEFVLFTTFVKYCENSKVHLLMIESFQLKALNHLREEEESCFCGGAAVLLCFVSGRPEGSSLYQLWTLVLQTVHHQLILGPVCFIRRLLLSPVWKKIQNKSAGLQTASQTSSVQNGGLQEVLDEYKISLRRRCERVTEGTDEAGSETLLNRIYTELYITEGQSEEVNTQHEKHIRVVLTNGVAGVGKTFSVQKFTLDWAEGLENQDVSLLILFSFRELNLIKDEQYSLLMLLHVFHPTLQKVTAEQLAVCKLLFIFDGLDESRLSLDFYNSEVLSDVTQKSSVNVLLTNLIKGNLLPSALVWITSRPAAANQMPPEYVDRLTEVRGFTDTPRRRSTSGGDSVMKICPAESSHTSRHPGLSTSCVKSQFSAGSLLQFWTTC